MIGCLPMMALVGFFLVLTVIGSLTFGDGDAAKAIGRTMFMQSEPKVAASDEQKATQSRKALLLRRRAFEMRSELRWMLEDSSGSASRPTVSAAATGP